MSSANEYLGVDLFLVNGDLAVASDGDLVVTPDGRVALLQDIAHLLEALPGELLAHPDHGAGVVRLFGETNRNLEGRLARGIEDAINYSPAVAGRIVQGSVRIVTALVTERELSARVDCEAILDGTTNSFNFVWGWGINDISRIAFA